MIADPPCSVLDLVTAYWPIAACSFGVALVATPIVRAFARARRIVDRPDDFLKPHKTPIPYLGGVAIFLAWAGGIAVAVWRKPFPLEPMALWGILVAGLAIMIIGLFDDIRIMKPRVKLVLNIAVGLFLLWLGVGRNVFGVIIQSTALRNDPPVPWLELFFSIPFGLFIVVGACNATNLIDGLDGLCGGVLGIISVGFFLLAAHLALWGPDRPINQARVVLSLAMLGAAAGFLPYNINPASIFMGDAGSMLLGLNAAILIILFCEPGQIRWMFGACAVFGLPIADMMLTLVRRWRNARPLMIGDRSHFYDQLVDRGYTVRQVVAISYALTTAFVIVGVATAIFVRTRYAVPIYAGLILAVVIAVGKFRMVDLMPPDRRRANGPDLPPVTK
jgi:UDP-GlcNAc:undecaprenyl-phosphate GlcNAc-1-phosphate transferase